SSVSPTGTLWAAGTSLLTGKTYKNFVDLVQELTSQSPYSSGYSTYMPIFASDWFKETYGVVSLKVEETNELFDVDFLSWTTGRDDGGGGFAYKRYKAFHWIQPAQLEGTIVPGSSFELEVVLDASNLN